MQRVFFVLSQHVFSPIGLVYFLINGFTIPSKSNADNNVYQAIDCLWLTFLRFCTAKIRNENRNLHIFFSLVDT